MRMRLNRARGANELLIRLDGQELYEPYHLRDFDNALSIVTTSRIAKVSLVTALPASYGDRAAGGGRLVADAGPNFDGCDGVCGEGQPRSRPGRGRRPARRSGPTLR